MTEEITWSILEAVEGGLSFEQAYKKYGFRDYKKRAAAIRQQLEKTRDKIIDNVKRAALEYEKGKSKLTNAIAFYRERIKEDTGFNLPEDLLSEPGHLMKFIQNIPQDDKGILQFLKDIITEKEKTYRDIFIKKNAGLTHRENCWINFFKSEADLEKRWDRKYCSENKIRLSDFYSTQKKPVNKSSNYKPLSKKEFSNIVPHLKNYPTAHNLAVKEFEKT